MEYSGLTFRDPLPKKDIKFNSWVELYGNTGAVNEEKLKQYIHMRTDYIINKCNINEDDILKLHSQICISGPSGPISKYGTVSQFSIWDITTWPTIHNPAF